MPQLLDVSDDRFSPADRPGPDHGPAAAADLDGDGRQDLVIPGGTSGAGLRFLGQAGDGTLVPRTHWPLNVPAGLQANTWDAACGDYDGDGQLDVYLCRSTPSSSGLPGVGSSALPDLLLRSDLANASWFVDTSSALEIPLDGDDLPIHLASSAAAWCDFDADGDLDLAVADGAGGRGVFIYENDPGAGPPRFRIVFPDDPANPTWQFNVSDLVWVDIDNDGDEDLMATTFSDQTSHGSGYVFVNDGLRTAGRFVDPLLMLDMPPRHASSGVRTLDHDLDGDLDFLLLPDEDDGLPLIVLNHLGSYSGLAGGIGLGAIAGRSHGGLVTDLNGDGLAELFFGRPQADHRFFCTAGGNETMLGDWIALDLREERSLAGGGTRATPAVGARVAVTTGTGTVALTVGANGTSDRVLRIGVADGHTPDCTVHWPSGHVTSHPGLAVGDVHVLTAPATTGLQDATVYGFPEVLPDQIVDWVFEWTTDHRTDPALDRVVFEQPFGCPLSEGDLRTGDPGVTVTQWYDTSGPTPVFRHRLRWQDRPCSVCTQSFHIECGRSGVIETSSSKTFRIRFCTTVDPQDPPGGE